MPEIKPLLVNCPTCGVSVAWSAENRYRPFCSKRCKMIDLGEWAAENYRLPDREIPVDDEVNSGQT